MVKHFHSIEVMQIYKKFLRKRNFNKYERKTILKLNLELFQLSVHLKLVKIKDNFIILSFQLFYRLCQLTLRCV